MHDVEAHVARPDHAEQGIHVGSVVVEQAATAVHEFRDLHYVALEESERVGVRHHYAGDIVSEQRFQGLDVHKTVRIGLHDHYLESADGGGGRVRAVRAVGNYDLGPRAVAAAHVVLPHQHQAGKLAMGSGAGQEGETLHARDSRERLVEAFYRLLGATHGRFGLQGMQSRESGQ